jgi:hypothetical protein
MSNEFTIECEDCGGEYLPEREGPEHHDKDCPIRAAYIESGRWEEP